MTIPCPDTSREERAELAVAFAERFISLWDNPPADERELLVAVSHHVAELVIHACVPDAEVAYVRPDSEEGLLGYQEWRTKLSPLFPTSLGFYRVVDPFDRTTGELDFDDEAVCGDAIDDLADIMCALEETVRMRDESGVLEAHESLVGAYRCHLGHAHAGPLLFYIDRTLMRLG